MAQRKIVIDPNEVYTKHYSIRATGKDGYSYETCIPKEVLEREARRRKLSLGDVVKQLMVEWRFNSFHGMHMIFVTKEEVDKRR